MDGACEKRNEFAIVHICDRFEDRSLATETLNPFEISGFLYRSLENKDVIELLYERQNSLRRRMTDRRRQTD